MNTKLLTISRIPELLAEWDWEKNALEGLSPETTTQRSNKKAWWRCREGHSFQSPPNHHAPGKGCPYCSGRKAIPGTNDLRTVNPQLAAEWDYERNIGIQIDDILPGSGKKVWWRCHNGHHWQASVNNRTNHQSGCPFCSGREVISGCNDLATLNPQLASEWNFDKNPSDIAPTTVTSKSKRKVWWRCKVCQYEWQTSVSNRARGTNCPQCSKKTSVRTRVRHKISADGSLAQTMPSLALAWNYSKNAGLTPDDYTTYSNQRVWWICPICGHEWCAVINSRASGVGCPQCAIRYGTSFPEQALFFYIKQLFPDAQNRYRGTSTEDMEIDIFIPSAMIAIEYDGAHWHTGKTAMDKEMRKYEMCKRKGIYLYRVSENKATSSSTCDDMIYCAYRRITDTDKITTAINQFFRKLGITTDVNVSRDEEQIRLGYYSCLRSRSLLVLHPELSQEWNAQRNNGLTPAMFNAVSAIKVWWRCHEGHEWKASIANRVKGRGCPFCANKQVLRGYNDLLTLNPELAEEWHETRNGELKPNMVTSGSNKSVWWRCSKGHEWQAAPATRKTTGCPICAGQQVLPGYNDLLTQFPELAKEWNCDRNGELLPQSVTSSSSKKVWWKCKKGHEWQAVINSRRKGNGCPICANKRVLPGYNDIQTTHPELVIEWDFERNLPLLPTMVTGGSGRRVWWMCQKGHRWQAYISNRTKGHGCPYCSGRYRVTDPSL